MTIDAIIAEVQGRTHSEGDTPARDELLVVEVLRLREVLADVVLAVSMGWELDGVMNAAGKILEESS